MSVFTQQGRHSGMFAMLFLCGLAMALASLEAYGPIEAEFTHSALNRYIGAHFADSVKNSGAPDGK